MTEMEDLQAPHYHPLAPLCIKVGLFLNCAMPLIYYSTDILYMLFQNQDPRDYFDSLQLKTSDDTRAGTEQLKCSLSSEEAYGSFMGSVSEIKAVGLSDPIVRPEVAVMVITSLFCANLKIITLNEIVVDFVNFHSNFGRTKSTLHDMHGNRSGDRVNKEEEEADILTAECSFLGFSALWEHGVKSYGELLFLKMQHQL
ncbi:hypothetical protein CMV_006290 [Castanea mollissima]|uniref:Uncharacterized protein n=1 Tax=Castanea mollissima TaxID=60419 RepID=A0A8J4RPL7_9ROSI|nr:hypothetical protein CMV_006290 [Castanea mollissima]